MNALIAMGSVFLLIFVAVMFAAGFLLWWLAVNKKREIYIAIFAIVFLYGAFTSWQLFSGLTLMWQVLLAAWTYFITSIAMWQAANRDNKVWFVALYFLSFFGILPAIYVFFVERLKVSQWYK